MKLYRVRWAEVARTDLFETVDFIAERSPRAAGHVLDQLEARAQTLARLPTRGRIVLELRRLGITAFRGLIVDPWRIIYRVDDREVRVLAVLDGRRELVDLLLQRLLGLQ